MMKKLARNNRGQFVVGAALIIAVLTLGVALSIYQVSLHRQQLMYEPVKELVLGITSDLDRTLTFALRKASQKYNETRSEELAETEGYPSISRWVRSILTSYSHLGIKMNMSVPVNSTQGGLRDVLFHFDWGQRVGLSYVYTKFDLDVNAYGFKGWVGYSGKFVKLTIFPESINISGSFSEGSTTLNFHVQDNEYPIPNLTPDSLKIYAHISGNLWSPATIKSLSYEGVGNYSVEFSPRINNNTLGVRLTVVTPEDHIYVSAYSYQDAPDWSTLYVDSDSTLMPPYLWSGRSGKMRPSFSTGNEKQVAVCNSPSTPTIYLARYLNVTAFVRPNPPSNVKDITLELGFTYNGLYYRLGSATFPVNAEGAYTLTIDILGGEFPEGFYGIIPKGSVINLTVTVTFFKPPWGTFFLYYGPDKPSSIKLYHEDKIK